MRSGNITITLGVSAVIEATTVELDNRRIYILFIGTDFPTNVGTEAVSLLIDGVEYPVIDSFGNRVVLGRMRDGIFGEYGNIETAKYRLGFGTDGLPASIPHFVVFNGLCPMRFNGPAGSPQPPTAEG